MPAPRSLCNLRLYVYKYEILNYTIATKKFLFLFHIIMLINGRPFAVSTERFDILRRMCPSAGTSPLLSEFRPVRFPYDADIWQLLYKCSYSQGICCFLAGQFVLYMAGTFQTFNAASLFITLLATPLSAVTRTFGHFLLQRIPLCIFGSRR